MNEIKEPKTIEELREEIEDILILLENPYIFESKTRDGLKKRLDFVIDELYEIQSKKESEYWPKKENVAYIFQDTSTSGKIFTWLSLDRNNPVSKNIIGEINYEKSEEEKIKTSGRLSINDVVFINNEDGLFKIKNINYYE